MKAIILFFLVFLISPSAMSQNSVDFEDKVNPSVVKDWVGSLFRAKAASSKTYIVKKSGGEDDLHKMKHRDVVIWIPGSSDLTKEFVAVLWFHGHWGYVPARTFEDRVLKQFIPLAHSRNFVIIIPEMPWSVHTRTPTKRNSKVWTKPGDFINFISQVEKLLFRHMTSRVGYATRTEKRLGKIDYRIIGHSAGGSTIKRLGITGDLCTLNPSMVIWSDSSYGSWLDDAWNGCLKDHPDISAKVFVKKGGPPWKNAMRFFKKTRNMSSNIRLYVKGKGWSHKLIGNNIVKLSGVVD